MDASTSQKKEWSALLKRLNVDEQEIRSRKEFLGFDDRDVDHLSAINNLASQYADQVIEDFYGYLLSFEDTRAFFTDLDVLARVKAAQKDYFLQLTQGNYGIDYIENRLKVGAIHERIALPVKSYLGMHRFYLRTVGERIFEHYKDDPAHAFEVFLSLVKLIFLDISFAIDTYIESREQTIGQQQEAIRELSTPVLPFREGILILPIVGMIDSYRANQLTEQLLNSIRSNRAKMVLVDITGVPFIDSRVASHLVQTIEAVRLMGSTVIVSGVSPAIAMTMVALGIDLGRVETVGDMQSGIERAEQLSGYRVSKLHTGYDSVPDERSNAPR